MADSPIDHIATELVARILAMTRWRTQSLRALRRDCSGRLKGTEPRCIVHLATRLLEHPGIEFRFVASELIHYHRPALRSLRAKDLERLGHGIDSWGAVDTFACYLAGPAWRERQVSDRLVHRWARSKDRWWRRAALVSTVPLNNRAQGGRGDTERTLAVCRLLAHDRDDMVVKALSWALRELAKRDPKGVRQFLAKNAAILAPRVVRETRNKLTTGLKNPRKRVG